MDKLFETIFKAPVTTLLIMAALFFLLIAVLSNIGGKIQLDKAGRFAAGIIGLILLLTGLLMPSKSPAPGVTSTKHSKTPAPPTVTSDKEGAVTGNEHARPDEFDVTIAITITHPRNGSEVERDTIVKGTASIPGGYYVWVLVRRYDFAPLWWPQREVKIDPKTNEWRATAIFGGPQDIGWDFDIGVIVVNEDGHRELMNYWTRAMKKRDWRPIQIPATSSPPYLLRVRKVRH